MFRPLNKNVLLKKYQSSSCETTLYLGNKNTSIYQVISVGKEVLEVKNNDLVYVCLESLKNITINNEEYYIIDEKDIYLVVED